MNDEPVNDDRTLSSATQPSRRWSGRRTVLLSLMLVALVAGGTFLALNITGGNGSGPGAPSGDPVTGTVWVANEEGGEPQRDRRRDQPGGDDRGGHRGAA